MLPWKQEAQEAAFLLGGCAVAGGASGTRAACRTTEDEELV